jgi:hypothetical protein
LFEHSIEREVRQIETQAALRGVKLKSRKKRNASDIEVSNNAIFKSPAAYESMSENDRQVLTDKMKKNHKQWWDNSGLSSMK